MITRLRLHNFQKHEKLDVKLGRVTTFVGPSDAGKSAVIRALRWLLHNQPAGARYVRDGAERLRVAAKIDGHTIRREKRKQENAYFLDDAVFKAFKRDVPEEISNLHRVRPSSIQGQHDGIFWMSLSGGQLAAELNEIVDLQRLIRAQSLAKQDLQRVGRDHKEAVDQIEALQPVEEELKKVLALQKLWDRDLDDLRERHAAFMQLASVEGWADVPVAAAERVGLTASHEALSQQAYDVDEIRENYRGLSMLAKEVQLAEQVVQRSERVLALQPLIAKVVEARRKRIEMGRRGAGLVRLVTKINIQSNYARDLGIKEGALKLSVNSKLKPGKTCPLCQTTITR